MHGNAADKPAASGCPVMHGDAAAKPCGSAAASSGCPVLAGDAAATAGKPIFNPLNRMPETAQQLR